MHEMSVAMEIVSIVERAARDNRAKKIVRVTLEVGQISGVEPEALRFAYDAIVKDKALELGEPELEIIPIGARARCLECAAEFEPEYRIFLCPKCDEFNVELIAGKELTIKNIEIEN